jgi:hypothetical protein
MTRYLSLSFAILAIAASLSTTPAGAQPRCDAGHAFVLMLGVGY